jgi:CheY-like chemotaxis protein
MLTSAATVMVVDDDPLVLASTVAMLDDLGNTAVEAGSGQEALELLRAGARVDLVITDYAMPGMTGLQLAEELPAGGADVLAVEDAEPGHPVLLVPYDPHPAPLSFVPARGRWVVGRSLAVRPPPFGPRPTASQVAR